MEQVDNSEPHKLDIPILHVLRAYVAEMALLPTAELREEFKKSILDNVEKIGPRYADLNAEKDRVLALFSHSLHNVQNESEKGPFPPLSRSLFLSSKEYSPIYTNTNTPESKNSPNPPTSLRFSLEKRRRIWLDSFEKFWVGYPRKERKNSAQRAWLRLMPKEEADFEDRAKKIVDLLNKRITEWYDRPKSLLPLPGTFLNGECFD